MTASFFVENFSVDCREDGKAGRRIGRKVHRGFFWQESDHVSFFEIAEHCYAVPNPIFEAIYKTKFYNAILN
jgi:hypothetical protein